MEILPSIFTFIRFLVGAVATVSMLSTVIAGVSYVREKDEAKRAELKGMIVSSLIAVVIALIVYFLLVGIGPAFRIIFKG